MSRIPVIGVALVLALTASTTAAEELVVVVHRSNPTASLDAKSVRALFLRTQPSWDHRERVRPIDHADQTAPRAAFLARVLGLTTAEYDRYWIERQYANGELPPIKATDEASVVRFVSTLKGTIAFLSKREAERASAEVKIVMTLEY